MAWRVLLQCGNHRGPTLGGSKAIDARCCTTAAAGPEIVTCPSLLLIAAVVALIGGYKAHICSKY